ncbi:DNAase [Methylotenera oryzisoli]|uniref:DNAase n=1 Tax=Methylotenera oryzisoli TaxID=2080758 RepID=A0A4Y9VQH2_9PROT|nr:TatD family hydrolase [Methylotenera oryzisoli]TFW70788.1 DNAase [Methylotenera oryzisoli]
MLIDTHCHLDATEFDADRDHVVRSAFANGVSGIVVPAVARFNFDAVINLCQHYQNCVYALGVHPMYVARSSLDDLELLRTYVQNHQPVAIGEIGLDYFLTNPSTHPENIKLQTHFFIEQLKIAQAHDLPVILHVRHAIDDILKQLRKHKVKGGIAHAFNGSMQQAEQLIALGFKLGFGGAMTYPRALRIRALATQLPLEAIVLETDAPDIPPEWLGTAGRNSPAEVLKIAQVLADLRQVDVAQVLDITGANAIKIMPKLADLCTPVNALH